MAILFGLSSFTYYISRNIGGKMTAKSYLAHYCNALFAFSSGSVKLAQFVIYLALILPTHPVPVAAGQQPTNSFDREGCSADLENKFLSTDGKCPYSGLVPVKGSCTEYIPCISFGGELVKPLKRTECPKSAGLGFDIEYLQCRPMPDFENCLQRVCFSKGINNQIRQQNESTSLPSGEEDPIPSSTVPVPPPSCAMPVPILTPTMMPDGDNETHNFYVSSACNPSLALHVSFLFIFLYSVESFQFLKT